MKIIVSDMSLFILESFSDLHYIFKGVLMLF